MCTNSVHDIGLDEWNMCILPCLGIDPAGLKRVLLNSVVADLAGARGISVASGIKVNHSNFILGFSFSDTLRNFRFASVFLSSKKVAVSFGSEKRSPHPLPVGLYPIMDYTVKPHWEGVLSKLKNLSIAKCS